MNNRTIAQLRPASWLALAFWLVACGGEPAPEPEAAPAPAAVSGGESAPSSGMQVEGILGTIPTRKIEETMQAKLPAFQRCFFEGMGEVELLAGYMKFYFRVGLDGNVEWVEPRSTNIGHRGTEQCLLGVAGKTHFPKPKGGGPAEFAWGFELDAPGGVRAPVAWEEARVQDVLAAQRASLDSCELPSGHYLITAYVATGGSVMSVGAAADSSEAVAKIDCALTTIKTWTLPDPGSYPAKVSFHL